MTLVVLTPAEDAIFSIVEKAASMASWEMNSATFRCATVISDRWSSICCKISFDIVSPHTIFRNYHEYITTEYKLEVLRGLLEAVKETLHIRMKIMKAYAQSVPRKDCGN